MSYNAPLAIVRVLRTDDNPENRTEKISQVQYYLKLLGLSLLSLDGIFPKRPFMYGHTYSKSMDQPDKVANPARGQYHCPNTIGHLNKNLTVYYVYDVCTVIIYSRV